jgi:hypothetical protein
MRATCLTHLIILYFIYLILGEFQFKRRVETEEQLIILHKPNISSLCNAVNRSVPNFPNVSLLLGQNIFVRILCTSVCAIFKQERHCLYRWWESYLCDRLYSSADRKSDASADTRTAADGAFTLKCHRSTMSAFSDFLPLTLII